MSIRKVGRASRSALASGALPRGKVVGLVHRIGAFVPDPFRPGDSIGCGRRWCAHELGRRIDKPSHRDCSSDRSRRPPKPSQRASDPADGRIRCLTRGSIPRGRGVHARRMRSCILTETVKQRLQLIRMQRSLGHRFTIASASAEKYEDLKTMYTDLSATLAPILLVGLAVRPLPWLP